MSHQGLRQHQRRPALRPRAVRRRRSLITMLYVRWADREARPDRRRSIRDRARGGPSDDRPRRRDRRQTRPSTSPSSCAFVAAHARHRLPGLAQQQHRRRLLRRRPLVHRPAERHRHLRRLPVGRVVPRHRRRDRDQRVRRLPVLDRLPGRVAGRPAAGRRAAAQHRPVHDGRRAVVPAAAAAGPDGRRDHHPRGVVLLPAGPDGRRRRAGRAAARRRLQGRPEHRHRRRRRDHDPLRPGRRHEGHHLGADRQGRRCSSAARRHDVLGAREVRLQPVRPARATPSTKRQRRSSRASSTASPDIDASSTSSRCRSRWCSAPPACRTC